jgi:YVTN family beta-propeller protein
VNIFSNSVTVLDGSTDAVVATIPVGVDPYSVAVNPVTNRIYVANQSTHSVTVIDGVTHGTVDIPAGVQPSLLAVNTITDKVYVAGGQANGDVTVIDGATNVTTHIAIPFGPWGFATLNAISVNEVTNRIYVVDSMSENLIVVDGVTNEVSLRPVGRYPYGATINTATNKVYVSSDGVVTIISE